jgi:hypothetical protein
LSEVEIIFDESLPHMRGRLFYFVRKEFLGVLYFAFTVYLQGKRKPYAKVMGGNNTVLIE